MNNFFNKQIFEYSISLFSCIISLTALVITGVQEGFLISQTKLTITCALHIVINQVCERLIKLYMLICLFYPLQYDIISLTDLKITQVIHLLLDICKNGKPFFNLGISIFRISVYLRMKSELNSNIWHIRFSPSLYGSYSGYQQQVLPQN